MVDITIHFPSVVIGAVLGMIVLSIIFVIWGTYMQKEKNKRR